MQWWQLLDPIPLDTVTSWSLPNMYPSTLFLTIFTIISCSSIFSLFCSLFSLSITFLFYTSDFPLKVLTPSPLARTFSSFSAPLQTIDFVHIVLFYLHIYLFLQLLLITFALVLLLSLLCVFFKLHIYLPKFLTFLSHTSFSSFFLSSMLISSFFKYPCVRLFH